MKRMKLALLLLVSGLAGCQSYEPVPMPVPPPAPPVVPEPVGGSVDEGFYRVRTFFATDRDYTPDAAPNDAFGPEPDQLRYGVADVSIPHDHRMGEVERPWIFRRENPERHVVLLSATVLASEAFYQELARDVQDSPGRNALIFVHGYNVSFPEAAYRTAQMAYDLKFDGAPVFYSWPSADAFHAYAADARNIEWSQANIERFLVDFFRQSRAENVYLVSHSMGNRAVTRALIAAARAEPGIRTRLKHVVLAAPDVDAAVFRTQLAPALAEIGAPVTLYASSGDLALRAAQQLYGGFRRAGQSGPDLVVVRGIQTIDASAVETGFLGHSYYGEDRSILSDMFHMFRGRGPEERSALARRQHADGHYWEFRR